MKYLALILALAFSFEAMSQTTPVKTVIINNRGKSIGKKVTGISPDGFRTSVPQGSTDTMMLMVYRWRSDNLGVTDNMDATNKVNEMLGLVYVPEGRYGCDTLMQISISGIIDHTTKPAVFERGTVFVGGIINFGGQLVTADPDEPIFGTTAVTGIKTKDHKIPIKWFGAMTGTTDCHSAIVRAMDAAYDKEEQVYFGDKGNYQINSVLNVKRSLVGIKEAVIRYNPASVTTGLNMITVNEDSIKISVGIDGSNVVRRGIFIADNMTDVEIAYCRPIKNITQVGASTATVEGIFFGSGMDRLNIHHNTIIDMDAPNTGVVNGIRGASTGPSPKGVHITYNYFDRIKSSGVSDDADQIKIQDYTDSLGMHIAYNIHNGVWKRAMKIQASGIRYYKNDIRSTRYITDNQRSYAAVSIYARACQVTGNNVYQGVFDIGIEVGAVNTSGWDNITIKDNNLYLSVNSLGVNDGIRVFGRAIKHLLVDNNYVENVRKGIWIDGNTYQSHVTNNRIHRTAQTAISFVVTSGSFPYNWNYGTVVTGNRVVASATSGHAYEATKINGFAFNSNYCDSTTNLLNNSQANADSIIGNVSVIGNVNFTTNGRSPNKSSWANRMLQTNSAAYEGLETLFISGDSTGKFTWFGGVWRRQF